MRLQIISCRQDLTCVELATRLLRHRGGFFFDVLDNVYMEGDGHSPLTSGLRDQFSEVPETAPRNQFSCDWIPLGRPFGGQFHGRDFRSLAFRDLNDAFLCEALVGVSEGLLVDGFEVGEVALVVEGFSKLGR